MMNNHCAIPIHAISFVLAGGLPNKLLMYVIDNKMINGQKAYTPTLFLAFVVCK